MWINEVYSKVMKYFIYSWTYQLIECSNSEHTAETLFNTFAESDTYTVFCAYWLFNCTDVLQQTLGLRNLMSKVFVK